MLLGARGRGEQAPQGEPQGLRGGAVGGASGGGATGLLGPLEGGDRDVGRSRRLTQGEALGHMSVPGRGKPTVVVTGGHSQPAE